MELEDLKQGWKQMDERLATSDIENKEMTLYVMNQKITTVRDKLKRKFMLGLAILLMLPGIIHLNERAIGSSFSNATWIALAAFFLAMAIRQIIWLRDLREVDCLRQTAREACIAEVRLRKHIKMGVGAGLVLAIPFFIFFFLDIRQWGNQYIVLGAACGAVVGFTIGFFKLRNLLKDVDSLNQTLHEIKE